MAAPETAPVTGPTSHTGPAGGGAPGQGSAASTGHDPIAPVGRDSVLGVSLLVLGVVLILGTLVALWARRRRR